MQYADGLSPQHQLQQQALQMQQLQDEAAPQYLTAPHAGVSNNGHDNENNDLILWLDQVLYPDKPLLLSELQHRYQVRGMLGQGTFGQVVHCQCLTSGASFTAGDSVAVKVIKNQNAFYHQAKVEIGVLQYLNKRADPYDEHNIVRMLDYFDCRGHLCLVFELLNMNLYELIKRNSFRGLAMNLLRSFLDQILRALALLRDASIIHCDLKPENVLLKHTLGDIKVIDFGSACFEAQTMYSYIQSRFYRSPEVLLGYPYNTAIDMWSLGCMAAELFLGLPLFPGASEHDLLTRMVDMLGTPPDHVLERAQHTHRYFRREDTTDGFELGSAAAKPSSSGVSSLTDLHPSRSQRRTRYTVRSQEEFERMFNAKAPAGKRYFSHSKLCDIVDTYPYPSGIEDGEKLLEERQGGPVLSWPGLPDVVPPCPALGPQAGLDEQDAPTRPHMIAASCAADKARSAFLDFLAGVLDLDPAERWTPRQALLHPFITGEAWTGFFQPQADPHTPAPPGDFPSDPLGIPEQSQYVGGSFSQIKGMPMAMQQQWPQEMHVRAHAVAMAAVQAQFSPQGTSLALQDSLSAGQPGETRVTGMPAYLPAPGASSSSALHQQQQQQQALLQQLAASSAHQTPRHSSSGSYPSSLYGLPASLLPPAYGAPASLANSSSTMAAMAALAGTPQGQQQQGGLPVGSLEAMRYGWHAPRGRTATGDMYGSSLTLPSLAGSVRSTGMPAASLRASHSGGNEVAPAFSRVLGFGEPVQEALLQRQRSGQLLLQQQQEQRQQVPAWQRQQSGHLLPAAQQELQGQLGLAEHGALQGQGLQEAGSLGGQQQHQQEPACDAALAGSAAGDLQQQTQLLQLLQEQQWQQEAAHEQEHEQHQHQHLMLGEVQQQLDAQQREQQRLLQQQAQTVQDVQHRLLQEDAQRQLAQELERQVLQLERRGLMLDPQAARQAQQHQAGGTGQLHAEPHMLSGGQQHQQLQGVEAGQMHRQQVHLLPVGAGHQHQPAHQPMEAPPGAGQQQQQAPLLQSTYQEGLLQAGRAHTRARSRSPVGSMALEADEVHRQLQEAARKLPAGPGSSRPGSLGGWQGSLSGELAAQGSRQVSASQGLSAPGSHPQAAPMQAQLSPLQAQYMHTALDLQASQGQGQAQLAMPAGCQAVPEGPHDTRWFRDQDHGATAAQLLALQSLQGRLPAGHPQSPVQFGNPYGGQPWAQEQSPAGPAQQNAFWSPASDVAATKPVWQEQLQQQPQPAWSWNSRDMM